MFKRTAHNQRYLRRTNATSSLLASSVDRWRVKNAIEFDGSFLRNPGSHQTYGLLGEKNIYLNNTSRPYVIMEGNFPYFYTYPINGFINLPQPFTIVLVVRQSSWANDGTLVQIDGRLNWNSQYYHLRLCQRGTSPNLQLYTYTTNASTEVVRCNNITNVLNTWQVITLAIYREQSYVQINNLTPSITSSAIDDAYYKMSYLTIGSGYTQIADFILFDQFLPTSITTIKNYYMQMYGIS